MAGPIPGKLRRRGDSATTIVRIADALLMFSLPALPPPDRVFARAINVLLTREGWARERLARHGGKTVRFASGRMNLSLTVTGEGLLAAADPAIVPDVVLTVPPEKLSWARFAPPNDAGAAFLDITHISGDAGLAQVVSDLAKHLRWDAEDDFARLVGDVPANRLTAGARSVARGARHAGRNAAANVAEYLSEERGVIVGKPLMQGFSQDADRVRRDAESLAARVADLIARLDRRDMGRS